MPEQTSCPCGSLLSYAACCGIYHLGLQIPSTAEALMRSRYAAFARQNAGYLLQTWDEFTKPMALDLSDDASHWQQLLIVKTQKGLAKDMTGQVEFKAFYTLSGRQYVLHELSRFIKRQERWYYVDGIIKANDIASAVAPSKNASCLCGSGKKYKRCCGAV